MSRLITNPPGLNDPASHGYSHTVSAPPGKLVFIAGQYGSDANGEIVSTDFAEQVQQAFVNLGVALEAVGLDVSHVVRIGTYIVDHDAEKLDLIVDRVQRTWGPQPPAQTLTGVATLALPDMLFEIDAVAVRPDPAARRSAHAPDIAERGSTGARTAALVRGSEAELLDGDAFAAAAGADADVLFVFTPGTARFDYYRLLDRAHRGEASWDEIADTQNRFDNHYVESPAWREARGAGPAA